MLFGFGKDHLQHKGEHIEGGDLVVGDDIAVGALIMGVVPDGGEAGVLAALDIGGKAVAYHDGAAFIEIGDLLKAEVEEPLIGLIVAHPLGDEDLLEVGGDTRIGNAAILNGSGAVGGGVEIVGLR